MSCSHTNISGETLDLRGESAVDLVRCNDCHLVGIRDPDGTLHWSGEARAGKGREADFKLAMQRLQDVELFFGLIAERWDVQAATLLESILRHVRILADSDFEGLVTVTGLAMQLADRAKRDQNLEIISHLVDKLGGEVEVPITALERTGNTTLLSMLDAQGLHLKLTKRPQSTR